MDDCVTKPIDRTKLALAINKAMGEVIHIPITAEQKPSTPDSSSGDGVDSEENNAAVHDFLKQIGADKAEDVG